MPMFHLASLILGLAIAAGCGPSAAQIADAKSAQYKGDHSQICEIVESVVDEDYKIGDRQREERLCVIRTAPQWYNPEGGRQSAGAGDYVQLSDRSVQLSLTVEVTAPTDDRIFVEITPTTHQYISGSPQPRELAADDPNLPPWVPGRVDSLYMQVHDRLKPYKH
jgi:hypothetical protein